MAAFDDPRYRILAKRAAAGLGTTDASIINAIIAHWRCEIGSNDAYPPRRNNPGNIARGAANDVSAAYTVETPNPQPGNPIVTFATPEYGADIYAQVLAVLPRYKDVRAAIFAQNGQAFMKAVAVSDYGTGLACMQGSYKNSIPAGATGWVETNKLARLFIPDTNAILRPLSAPTPNSFTFFAWVGPNELKTWAPGPASTLRYSAVFRKVLNPVHKGSYIRITDQGSTWHETV